MKPVSAACYLRFCDQSPIQYYVHQISTHFESGKWEKMWFLISGWIVLKITPPPDDNLTIQCVNGTRVSNGKENVRCIHCPLKLMKRKCFPVNFQHFRVSNLQSCTERHVMWCGYFDKSHQWHQTHINLCSSQCKRVNYIFCLPLIMKNVIWTSAFWVCWMRTLTCV